MKSKSRWTGIFGKKKVPQEKKSCSPPKTKNKSSNQKQPSSNIEEKREVELYIEKINKLIKEDKSAQKKAAQILSDMINKSKSKKAS